MNEDNLIKSCGRVFYLLGLAAYIMRVLHKDDLILEMRTKVLSCTNSEDAMKLLESYFDIIK